MNKLAFLPVRYDLSMVALSVAIAMLASYVALDLAGRVRTTDKAVARGWWIGGSITMGSGIWSMHFVGMLALRLPLSIGYDHGVTAWSWVAAVAVSGITLWIAGDHKPTFGRLVIGALAMGGGICAMHYTGMAAMVVVPGIVWHWGLVATSAGIAVGASGAALVILFWLRGLAGHLALLAQGGAAVVMGIAISGMHYTAMAAAHFAEGTVCLSADALGGQSLGMIVAIASVAMLTLTMLTSILDTRMQGRTAKLAASLRVANEELKQIAYRDSLTALPNRLAFEQRLHSKGTNGSNDPAAFAVLFVDLDDFKPINDSFGHASGDKVLCEVGKRLRALLREPDTVARAGGDEFLLLIESSPHLGDITRLARRILDAIAQPFALGAREARVSCSIGIALFPDHGPPEGLIACADLAMLAAKRAGHAAYSLFEAGMRADMREQVELLEDLQRAIAEQQFELYYQPKIDAASGHVTAAEALLRWHHPTRGMVSPAVFVPIAERHGLICAIGNWVIEDACRQARAWRAQGLRMRVAINLSACQLRQGDLVEGILGALERHRIEPAALTCEITESVAMEDTSVTQRTITRLGHAGVHFSIDDFGTGYSSLVNLRRLPAEELKIDRSFVKDMVDSADARAIVDSVVRLAHALALKVVAEGVETEAQRALLVDLGCDELQGYLLAKPMPAHALEVWATGGCTGNRPTSGPRCSARPNRSRCRELASLAVTASESQPTPQGTPQNGFHRPTQGQHPLRPAGPFALATGGIPTVMATSEVDHCSALNRRKTREGASATVAARDACLDATGLPDAIGATMLRVLGLHPRFRPAPPHDSELVVDQTHVAAGWTPIVACLRGADGATLFQPMPRDTSDATYSVRRGLLASDLRIVLRHERALGARFYSRTEN